MKKILWRGILLCLFCVLPISFVLAEDIHDIFVRAEIDKAFLTIGEPVTYTVTVEHAPDIRILSSIPAPDSDVLEIKKIEDIHRQEKKKSITGRKFILTTYRLGEFILEPVTIRYQKQDQPEKSLQTNKLYLTVKSVAEGETKEDIRDVKSVIPFPWRLGKLAWILLGISIILTGYWIYQILRHKKTIAPNPVLLLTPEEEAFLYLKELFESDLLKRGFIKMYYLRLSEIIKIYFEKHYKILAVESTTIEILRALRSRHLEPSLYQKIQYVLEAADLAKFAKWIPTPSEVIQINQKSEEIIKESAPASIVTAAEEGVSHGV